jgi:tripartite ATP-independent transporter DctP family solute receptor
MVCLVDGRAEAAVTFRLSYALASTHPIHHGAVRFKELVESRTNKAVEIQLFPDQVLGQDQDLLLALNLGTLDMALVVAGAHEMMQKEFQLTSLVYMFRDEKHAEAVFRGPVIQELSAKLLANKQIRVVQPFFYFGKRNLTANKEIRKPEDLKGLTIRTPNVRIHQEGVASLGGQAAPLPFPELYLALKQGVMDGQENPFAHILAGKLYEVQKYLIITEHITTNFMMDINEGSFKRLTPEQQKILIQAAQEAEAYSNELVRKSEEAALADLKKAGMIVIVPDKGPFIQVSEAVRQKYAKESPDLYRRIQETK